LKIVVTGAAGFIGSHACVELMDSGFSVVGVDNFCNSSPDVAEKIKKITGKDLLIHKVDIRDKNGLEKIFEKERPEMVVHFAGLKSVAESAEAPLKYYENNVSGTVCLLGVMQEFGVKKMIFSSSATVYGNNDPPFTEDSFVSVPANPYGKTKFMIEEILFDLSEIKSVILRYFNPVGAHKSGWLSENPKGIPNNLMPFMVRTASGELPRLNVFGNDYPTSDGTCIRDYIHVTDLAEGHVKAIEYLIENNESEIFNLGTGVGTSVLELIKTFEKVNKVKIKYKIAPRRSGDAAVCYASAKKAESHLNWKAEFKIEQMCADAWHARNRKQNPE
jgi:UDP-glucose 4-epimerase